MSGNKSIDDAIKDAEDAKKEEDARNKIESDFFHPRGRERKNTDSAEIVIDDLSPEIIPENSEEDTDNSKLHLKTKEKKKSVKSKETHMKSKISLDSIKSFRISKQNAPRVAIAALVVVGAVFFVSHKSHHTPTNTSTPRPMIASVKSQSWQSPAEEAYYNSLSIQNHGLELQSHCSTDFIAVKTPDGKTRNACAVWSVDSTKPVSLSIHWKSPVEENYYKSLSHMNSGLKLKDHCDSTASSDGKSDYKTCLIWVASKGS